MGKHRDPQVVMRLSRQRQMCVDHHREARHQLKGPSIKSIAGFFPETMEGRKQWKDTFKVKGVGKWSYKNSISYKALLHKTKEE